MAYLFATPSEQQEMLQAIGVSSVTELLRQIPESLQLQRPLDLPPALAELELEQHVRSLAALNAGTSGRLCFMGGGAYDHFIPSVVDEITSRGEFYTAYTPYQAEASQGTLQAFFEYQTLICQLTGMEVSNASLYEGGTAVSEAVVMAMRSTGRTGKIVVAGSLHPEYLQVVRSNIAHTNAEIVLAPCNDGTIDPQAVAGLVDENTACVVIQQPNFLGHLEDLKGLVEAAHSKKALAIVSVDPISLGVLQRPGDVGADIVVCEGQPLGIPLQFGGPYLGVLACRQEFIRRLPGRLIGSTVDRTGKHCFVLNLQAREQHIRRDKATSNICTNQGLMALRATVYLSLMGPNGLRDAATLCAKKAHYAAQQLAAIPGIRLTHERPFFKEFVIEVEHDPLGWQKQLADQGVDVGPHLGRFPELAKAWKGNPAKSFLVAVTESRTRAEIDRFIGLAREALYSINPS